MTYSIVYISKTGNTALLAEQIRTVLEKHQCLYFGEPDQKAAEAEVIFAGFWTDKGTCSEALASFLQTLSGKKMFLFGTAGFGGAESYFQEILGRVCTYLDESNMLIGHYMCQGKMPMSVRARYEALSNQNKEESIKMLENFDRAFSHPDAEDLSSFSRLIETICV